MHTEVAVAELERTCRVGEVSGYGRSQSLRMDHDSLEVFDADDDVHVLLHVEVFEVLGMQRDGGLKRLLERLCR